MIALYPLTRNGILLALLCLPLSPCTFPQTLAADAMTDDGENVLATEVLWTPQDESDVLSKRDLIQDYPELIDL